MPLFWIFACQNSPVEITVQQVEEILEIPREERASGTVIEERYEGRSVSTLSSYMQFYASNGMIYQLQEPNEPEFILPGEHVAAIDFLDITFLSIDGRVYNQTEDFSWLESSLSQMTGYTTEYFFSIPGTLFLGGAGRLFSWHEGHVQQIVLEGQEIIQAMGNEEQLYLHTPELFSYDLSSKQLKRLWDQPVRDIAVDGQGDLWFGQENKLYLWKSENQIISYSFTDEVVQLKSNLHGSGLWIRTESSTYFYRDTKFYPVDMPTGSWQDVDEHDRILIEEDGMISRVSIDRPVVLGGLPKRASISTLQWLDLIPTKSSEVTMIQVFISGQELEVDHEQSSFYLNPENLEVGLQNLNILMHTETDTHLTVHPFINQELPDVSWENDISPLHQEYCAECHGGATETVLVSKENWQQKIDIIIDVVSLETMPLGQEPLTPEQITEIRAWKQGGFQ